MRYLIMMLLCVSGFAQVPNSQSKLTRCQSVLSDELGRRINSESDRDKLATANKELEAKLADMTKRYEDAVFVINDIDNVVVGRPMGPDHTARTKTITDPLITGSAIQTLNDLNRLGEVIGQLVAHDSVAVDKYNALLTDYKEYVDRVGIQLAQARQMNAQQQRFNNALALYNLMPKYQPPQTINLRVADCTKLPALCVGQ